jgi:hypothetical protein
VSSPDRLQQANSLLNIGIWLGALIGPALAGLVVAGAGAGWAVVADAGSYAVSGVCLALLRVGWSRREGPSEHVFSEMATGWREFRSRTWLWAIVGQTGLWFMWVYAPFLTLGAVEARSRLGGAGVWGGILTSWGVGMTVATLATVRLRPARPLRVAELAFLAWILPVVALAGRAPVWLIAVAAFLGGCGQGVFAPLWDTTLQQTIPADVLSRVSAYDWLGSFGLLALGYVVVGPLARLITARGVLLLGAGIFAVVTALVLALPSATDPGPYLIPPSGPADQDPESAAATLEQPG